MKISDLFEQTISALLANKVRSGLTVLGIVIGIGSVITMISIGEGASDSITSNIQALGSNLLMIQPGMQRNVGTQVRSQRGSANTLTLEDAQAIQDNLPLVKYVAPQVTSRAQITAKGANTNTQVNGVTWTYALVRNIQIASGEFITDYDNSKLARVAVLGPTTAADLFGEDSDPVGQTIRINNINFKVIGVTAAKGGSGFGSSDDVIYIPLSCAQKLLTGSKYVGTINVQAVDADSLNKLQTEITDLLLERHKISDSAQADFQL